MHADSEEKLGIALPSSRCTAAAAGRPLFTPMRRQQFVCVLRRNGEAESRRMGRMESCGCWSLSMGGSGGKVKHGAC